MIRFKENILPLCGVSLVSTLHVIQLSCFKITFEFDRWTTLCHFMVYNYFRFLIVHLLILLFWASRDMIFALTFDLLNQTGYVAPGASCRHSGAQDWWPTLVVQKVQWAKHFVRFHKSCKMLFTWIYLFSQKEKRTKKQTVMEILDFVLHKLPLFVILNRSNWMK